MTLTAQRLRARPESFRVIADPRRASGRRHALRTVLAIAAGATLCGMRGYKAFGQRVQGLGQKGAQRISCRRDPDTREYRSGRLRNEAAPGVTCRTPDRAAPAALLRINRGHWSMENSCHHVLDMTCDEGCCRIRTGHGAVAKFRENEFAQEVRE